MQHADAASAAHRHRQKGRTLNPTVADYLAGKGAETATGNGGDVEAME